MRGQAGNLLDLAKENGADLFPALFDLIELFPQQKLNLYPSLWVLPLFPFFSACFGDEFLEQNCTAQEVVLTLNSLCRSSLGDRKQQLLQHNN